jgi:glutamate synthase domain-containing protein 1
MCGVMAIVLSEQDYQDDVGEKNKEFLSFISKRGE